VALARQCSRKITAHDIVMRCEQDTRHGRP
jgi:hypothetical protein